MQATDAGDTSADRARRYRRMADATRTLAWQAARPEDKDAYLDLAMQWIFLADSLRRARGADDA
ncbi:MAG: hypothetical protein ABW360_10050 [Phenylobacterium sp.]